MRNKKILTALMLTACMLSAGSVSFGRGQNIEKANALSATSEAEVPTIENSVELDESNLSVSISKSSITETSQSYQVNFSSKITAYTTSDKVVYAKITDPSYTGQETEQPDEELRPVYTSSIYRIMDIKKGKEDVIIPKTFKYGTKYIMNVNEIESHAIQPADAEKITSILIPDSIEVIYPESFEGLTDKVTFKVMHEEDNAPFDASVFPEGANVIWGYEPNELELFKLDGMVFGAAKQFGTGNNYFIGYHGEGEYYLPLYIGYYLLEDGKEPEFKTQVLPISSSAQNNYDAVGDGTGFISFTKSVDIELEKNQSVDDERIFFLNIFEAEKDAESGKLLPVLEKEPENPGEEAPNCRYYSHAKPAYLMKDNIDDYVSYEFNNIATFAGFTSITIDMDINVEANIYEQVKSSSYTANKANIDSGYMQIRYRLTSFNLAYYRITYLSNDEPVTLNVPITTPVDSYNLPKASDNKVTFLLENNKVAPDFSADKLIGLEFIGLYITLDLYVPSTNSIVTKSNVSTRFGVMEILPLSSQPVGSSNINLTLLIVSLIYTVIYAVITIAYFIYSKNKFKNDEFRRVNPRQFFKTATIGYAGLGIVILDIMFIIFRFFRMDNSIVVYNPLDAYVIVFSIAAILVIGYYIRFFTIMIKTNIEKNKTKKLKLDEDVDDDGTK